MTRQDRTGQDKTGQDKRGQDRTGQDRTVFCLSSLNGALPVSLRIGFKDDRWTPANLAFSEAEFSYLRIFQ